MKQIKEILSRLIGNQNIISNNILFIDFTGSHEKGQFLSQLFYWSSRTKRKDGFFAKKYDEWYEEIRIKKHSLRRYTKEFTEMGFLETKFIKFNGVPTIHYYLDQDKLIKELVTFCEGDKLRGLQIVTLEGDTELPSKEGDKLLPSINRDYTENTNIESAREENEQQPSKQPTTEWKEAANEILTDKNAVRQIKDQSNHSGTIRDFAKEYFLNLAAKGEWFRLTIPEDDGEKFKWKAKHIAGLTSWIIRDRKFYPNKKPASQPEQLAPYHKNRFDYSLLEK